MILVFAYGVCFFIKYYKDLKDKVKNKYKQNRRALSYKDIPLIFSPRDF